MDALINVFRERSMLEELDHPLVCNLRFAFQDDEYMYMVMDLMMGGDLRFHLNRKTFTEDAIRFWIAELACAIRYLHSKGVVHRDIKPDNVLLDDLGHVHITDFNIARHIRADKPLTSHSGTCAYMAPEVFRGGGYGVTVDWWSLGVLFYECIYGRSDNQEELKKMILKAPIKYLDMDPPVSPACVSAIQEFLERDISRRLGCGPNGFELIQKHPFFRNFDWPALENKELNPIFRPSSDRINFDATYDLEELLLEEQPLEAKSRRRKPRKRKDGEGSEKEAQYQLIEEKFKPFDYTVFERYEGWVDPVTRCVADPPEWVKPAAVEVANQMERKSQDGIVTGSVDLGSLSGISLKNGLQV
ncbi:10707_t:CDS:2 [Acaulospora colombiana]|uniref:10707_t:CDS:1 n=1 Tax=Acaulospora colombiana TaxID=27376 RepID=A0ACA9L3N4_9GLOM|nr:10707_t:CDS:2 [Acaulospora colombiana]